MRRHASRCRARRRQHETWRRAGHEGGARPVSLRLDHTYALRQHDLCGGALPLIEEKMGRHRGGRQREPLLHADAARLLAEADYPPSVKQTILLALRGGRPGKQTCLACGKAAQHCQFWLPPALLQAVPDSREHPAVYWLCTTHHGQLTDAEIVGLLRRRSRGGTAAR